MQDDEQRTVDDTQHPRLVTLEELRIESYFPLDAQTRSTCERLFAGGSVVEK